MKHALIALALAAALPFSAQAAEGLSYSYVEGDYVNLDNDGDGFGLRGSISFGDSNFYGLVSYSKTSFDTDYYSYSYSDANVSYTYGCYCSYDLDTTELGVGVHHSLSDNVDVIAELAYSNANFDNENFESEEADGFRASVGFRGNLTSKFEGLVKINYSNNAGDDNNDSGSLLNGYNSIGSSGNDLSATLGSQYKFNETWGLTSEMTFADTNAYLIGLRASF